MELVKPGLGLLFWMTITFSVVLFLLSKFAWKPILKAISEREDSINNALNAADEARKQMSALKADNEKLLNEARKERDNMLKEAAEMKNKILADAKKQADEDFKKKVASATDEIQKQKLAALHDLKAQVAEISVDMAEMILRKKMEDRTQQEAFVNDNLKSITLN